MAAVLLLSGAVIGGALALRNSPGWDSGSTATASDEPVQPPATQPASPATTEAAGPGVLPGFVEARDFQDDLHVLAAENREDVSSLMAGTWVPQVSSKCKGLEEVDATDSSGRWGYPDGDPEWYPGGIDDDDIARFHQGLAGRFEGVLLHREQRLDGLCEGRTTWVSLVRASYPSPGCVEAWCERRALPEGECLAREVTPELLDATHRQPLLLTTGLRDIGLEIPSSMSVREERRAVVCRDSAAELRISVFETARGEYPPGFDQTVEMWRAQNAPPTDATRSDTGYRVTGFTDDDQVYFVLLREGGAGAVQMEWRYPAGEKDRYDEAVEISVDSLYEAD